MTNSSKSSESFASINFKHSSRSAMAAGALALAFCLVVLPPLSAQNQTSAPPAGQQSTVTQAQDPYGADPPQQGQGAPPQRYQGPPPEQYQPPQYQGAQQPEAQPATPPPATLTLPAGTIIPVRVTQWLSSDRNHPGDTFTATLDQPIIVNGWVVARRGQSVYGQVATAEKAGHGNKASQLGLGLSELVLADGQQLPVTTQLAQISQNDPSRGPRSAGTIAATTIIGAAIGGVVGGGAGAAIGAGAGAGAGTAGVLSTRGRPTIIGPESLLTFRLQAPVDVSTEKSQQAFRPVSQRDYGRADQDAYAPGGPGRYAGGPGYGPGYAPAPGYPYPAPAYYYGSGYCGPWLNGCYPYGYPGPFIGFGFGRGFYGGPGFRGGFGPGFRGGFRR